METAAAHRVISGYTCGQGPAPPCGPDNEPDFLPFNNATRGQSSNIIARTFFPACASLDPK